MATPYICSACRSKLVRPGLRIACSVSRTSSRKQTTYARDDIDGLLQSADGRKQHPNTEARPAGSRYSSPSGSVRGRYSGKELRPEQLLNQLNQPGEIEANGDVPRPAAPRSRPPHRASHPVRTSNEDDGNGQYGYGNPSPTVDQLSSQLIAQASAADFEGCWQTLQQLGTECGDLTGRDARMLFSKRHMVPSLQRLLRKATEQWVDGLAGKKYESGLPSPLDIHKTLYRLRGTNPALYNATLWHVASGVADLYFANKSDDYSPEAVQHAIEILVQMWRICMAIQASDSRGSSAASCSAPASILADNTDWSFLPPIDALVQWKSDSRSHLAFESILYLLVPVSRQQADHSPQIDYASAALITLDLINNIKTVGSDGQAMTLSQLPENAPFARLLASILKFNPSPRIPISLHRKIEGLRDEVLRKKYESMVARLGLENHRTKPSAGLNEPQHTSFSNDTNPTREDPDESTVTLEFAEKPQTPQIESFALLNVKRLGRALESRDMYQVEKIRREVYAFAGSHKDNRWAVPLELYEHLMLTFLSLRNPTAAIEVWNHVMTLGYQPTVKTYSVMMRGARTAKDRTGMEAFWHKMRQSGFQPDEHAWSIRIFGLFGLDAARQGMDALNEMAREWLAAAKAKAIHHMNAAQSKQFVARNDLFNDLLSMYPGPVDGVPRPNVITMNSAISALAQRRDYIVGDVLRWGRSFGIEPDLVTYNALLNISMRKGEAVEAMNILQSMQKRGIQGDSTTWTVILTALFQGGFLDGMDHLAQQKKILNFVEALENKDSSMPGLDEKGYALIINHLLKQYSNASAADAVMRRMIETGRQPTPHIYTILVQYYFDTQPEPDLSAVQALWRHIESHNNGWGAVLDNVFYDRVIEGYARHHKLAGIQPALGFLKRARQAGQKTGWQALEAVARALAERQQWDRLQAIVDQVRVDMREKRGGTAGQGQESFFAFIHQVGLLDGGEKPDVQRRKTNRRKDGPLLRAAADAAEGAWSRSLAS